MTDQAVMREPQVVLREPRVGEYGWLVYRHGALYAQEYGWDERFEALVARIVADYVQKRDPARERGWVAVMGDRILGSVFVMKDSDEVARLRMLLVEPDARGFGLGRLLVSQCIRFASHAGYRSMVLFTVDVLHAARGIYMSEGFELVDAKPTDLFGEGLIGQTWRLELPDTPRSPVWHDNPADGA